MSEPEYCGHMTMVDGSHVPLTRAQADELLALADAQQEKRAADMPTVEDALRTMTGAFERLKELGFSEAIYCPKDGSQFDAIEAGSSGIHRCHYSGEWPDGHWWIASHGDLWPSRPILYRLDPEAAEAKKARMKTAAERFARERD